MTRKIADVRRDYEGGRLEEAQTPDNPFVMFDEWFSLA
ncbi:MAG TPA: pyridoxamine 5'-phosphate oxidase, partial [Halomonas sp.]|nr:pyridoxamine 5'-phosphate oxidase [Halomonas sp.]